MASDFTSILACLTGFEDHLAKRWAGRLHRLPCAKEEGFLLAVTAMMATPTPAATSQEFGKLVESEVLIWAKTVKAANITVN